MDTTNSRRIAISIFVLAAAASGCAGPDPAAHADEIERYRFERLQRLQAEDGWLTVIGLDWLEPGANRFGSAPENRIVLPADAAPPQAGVFDYDDGRILLRADPSAGITLCTAMASALTRLQVKKDIAMTGEITLRGRVLPVGGIKEKMLAAHRAGLRTILIPKENAKDLKDLPEHVRKELKFVMVEHMDEVLTKALVRFKGKVERNRPHYDVKELLAETESGVTAH